MNDMFSKKVCVLGLVFVKNNGGVNEIENCAEEKKNLKWGRRVFYQSCMDLHLLGANQQNHLYSTRIILVLHFSGTRVPSSFL
jgi:hypothetical protein